jgi:hypothetical protein
MMSPCVMCYYPSVTFHLGIKKLLAKGSGWTLLPTSLRCSRGPAVSKSCSPESGETTPQNTDAMGKGGSWKKALMPLGRKEHCWSFACIETHSSVHTELCQVLGSGLGARD